MAIIGALRARPNWAGAEKRVKYNCIFNCSGITASELLLQRYFTNARVSRAITSSSLVGITKPFTREA